MPHLIQESADVQQTCYYGYKTKMEAVASLEIL